jgi:NADH-quinone oxidoreductase subunit M
LFGAVLGAGYFLRTYRLAFFGPVRTIYVAGSIDLRRRELLVAALLALVVLAFGLYPAAVLDFTRTAGEEWVSRLSPPS